MPSVRNLESSRMVGRAARVALLLRWPRLPPCGLFYFLFFIFCWLMGSDDVSLREVSLMALFCAGRLWRHSPASSPSSFSSSSSSSSSFQLSIMSPLPFALTYALWSRLAFRTALMTAQALQRPIHGTFLLYDDTGLLALAPQTVSVVPPGPPIRVAHSDLSSTHTPTAASS